MYLKTFSAAVLAAATGSTLWGNPLSAFHRQPHLLPAAARALPATARAAGGQDSNTSTTVQGTGPIEVAFSPNEGAETLVLKVINSAHSEIKMLSYSFTSAPITNALIAAVHRGVKVTIVADKKNNMEEDRTGKARAALAALANAGADVRLISVFSCAHDKLMVGDAKTIEQGSFNYTTSAAHANSENALVNWDNPALAKAFLAHIERNYRLSVPFKAGY